MPDDSFPQPQADVDDLPADDIPADDLPSADLTDEDLPEVAELLDAGCRDLPFEGGLTDIHRRTYAPAPIDRDLAILLIEHDMKVVMNVSDHITVLDHGEKIAEGSPEEIRQNPRVVEAYLGSQA